MKTKFVSQLDADNYFVGAVAADESPLEPGEFLLPGGAVEIDPPVVPPGKRAKLVDGAFVLEDIPLPLDPTPEELAEKVKPQRAVAYMTESDPLFFKAQRGEAAMGEWLAKVEEIKARFPDPIKT